MENLIKRGIWSIGGGVEGRKKVVFDSHLKYSSGYVKNT